jgi:hypothetical protein
MTTTFPARPPDGGFDAAGAVVALVVDGTALVDGGSWTDDEVESGAAADVAVTLRTDVALPWPEEFSARPSPTPPTMATAKPAATICRRRTTRGEAN